MIGTAEDLTSKPLVLFEKAYPQIANESILRNQEMTDKEITEKLNNDTLEINDFMENTLLIGGGL
jgi:hypothetical protein